MPRHPLSVLVLALAGATTLCACPKGEPSAADASAPGDASLPGGDAGTGPRVDAGAPAPCDGWSRPSWVEQRGDARFLCRCGETTLEVTVFEEGTLRLRYQAEGRPDRSFATVAVPGPTPLRWGGPESELGICTDALSLSVFPDCRVRATAADGTVVLEDPAGGGYFENAAGATGVKRSLRADEHIYGLGEKVGPLDKRGMSLQMRNTDAFDSAWEGWPPTADPLYQAIPFYLGLVGTTAYGVFTDNSWRTRFDLGASDARYLVVTADGGVLDQYLFAGPALSDVVRRYTALTGRMPLPPRWALGYHQSRWGYSPDTEVRAICQQLRDRRIPADGIWLDIQHMDGFRSFTWDPVTFSDPQGLIGALEAQGFKVTVIVDPGIKVDPGWAVYTEGVAQGHFLKAADGSPFVGEVWPGPAVFPDFSAPATRSWWGGLLAPNVGLGVRGLWIDMNEPASFKVEDGLTVPDSIAAAGDGVPTTMAEVHNVYALLEAKATWEGMKAAAPSRRPFVLTRAGYAGIQRWAAVWTGDAPSDWQVLQTTLPMLLGLGLSGVSFAGSDVGGYSGRADAQMFARWMQLGAISPFFRGHTQNSGARQEPWVFGTEVEDISRAEISRRYELLPYLYSLFHESSRTGAPILRPLVYELPSDPQTHTLGDQAMLGPFLLVAPVLVKDATTRSVYLPPGRWFEQLSGSVREGPVTFEQGLKLAARPTFVREGAILPRQEAMQHAGERTPTVLELDLYPGAAKSSFALYEDLGDSFAYQSGEYSRVVFELQRTPTGSTLSASAREGSFQPVARTVLARVRRVDHPPTAASLDGQALAARASEAELRAAGEGYWWDAADLSVLVAFSDRAPFALSLQYDPALASPEPPVEVPFEVTVPAGTSPASTICIASSVNGWATHQPLAWSDPGRLAAGTLAAPRGEWFEYKFTRCDWATVEKWPGCVEATNRYGQAAAHPVRRESVALWADACP